MRKAIPLFLDIDKSFSETTVGVEVTTILKDLSEQNRAQPFSVILHNDPINDVSYVTGVIKDVFGYTTRKAVWLMLKAHFTGKSRLWSGRKSQAETYRNKLVSRGPDPNLIEKGAEPLKVTVEETT